MIEDRIMALFWCTGTCILGLTFLVISLTRGALNIVNTECTVTGHTIELVSDCCYNDGTPANCPNGTSNGYVNVTYLVDETRHSGIAESRTCEFYAKVQEYLNTNYPIGEQIDCRYNENDVDHIYLDHSDSITLFIMSIISFFFMYISIVYCHISARRDMKEEEERRKREREKYEESLQHT